MHAGARRGRWMAKLAGLVRWMLCRCAAVSTLDSF